MKKRIWLVLSFSFFCAVLWAQDRRITGTVTSKEKAPLDGVSVAVVGTKNAVATNEHGQFTITVPAKSAMLMISSTGYISQQVAINGRTVIDVQLVTETKELDDVVVIGYSSVQRRDVIGSVSSVTARQLKDVPLASTAQALQGRLAGVQITSTDGAPGAEMQIKVRGGGSITQDIAPLYIVDGVQVDDAFSTLSLQDIASIDVLKDASTTAIYGARGANGVVIITTKGGKPGKSQVSYTGSMGFKKMPKYLSELPKVFSRMARVVTW